ncbi:MAG: ATP-binding cassette domain-containing protein [Segetibacter sp.]
MFCSGIDLTLYKEENVVVLGRSGTGKSVLIKIISGFAESGQRHRKCFRTGSKYT